MGGKEVKLCKSSFCFFREEETMAEKKTPLPQKAPAKGQPVQPKKTSPKSKQDEQLAQVIAKLSNEYPSAIADVIKRWLEEEKNNYRLCKPRVGRHGKLIFPCF